MDSSNSISLPLVSVIIPCYNHGKYLIESVESVFSQTYKNFEIIIVDDGSVDDTRSVAKSLEGVQYIYQRNQGLSAARNTGIKNSKGSYLVFLDADDWLLPDALLTNINLLEQNKMAAFVSGAHKKVTDTKEVLEDVSIEVTKDHYLHLLQGNYIGMHATVMYQKWVFEKSLFDTSLKACEDYDLYLKIARRYPVVHHTKPIALYRIHQNNMSGNIPLMLSIALSVLKRQKPALKNEAERQAYKNGLKIWKEYYCEKLYQKLTGIQMQTTGDARELQTLFKYNKYLYFKYLAKKLIHAIKRDN